jgi:hexosaminidase
MLLLNRFSHCISYEFISLCKLIYFVKIFNIVFLSIIVFASLKAGAQQLPLIPYPSGIKIQNGNYSISSTSNFQIIYSDDSCKAIASMLSDGFEFVLKKTFTVSAANSSLKPAIILKDTLIKALGYQGYQLNIDKHGIIVFGKPQGIFYGTQTLLQLANIDSTGIISFPFVDIKDKPAFKWRGMHLDCCRHFFPVEFIKKYIDFIAMYKMNTFHWHLTDDQGWRIEIKKYPLLTQIGAFRKMTLVGSASLTPEKYDSTEYSGFYTQDEIKEIVAYASERFVTIVPEIEMPGHSLAALAAYPEFSCTCGPFEVGTKWGGFDDVFCPKDTTFKFLQNILDEVIDLFPGKYIHIGGDECSKTRWKSCDSCQALMKKYGLKNENELQSYFIERIEKYLNSKGKQIIGWDEILEGGLAPNAAVMSWRGMQGGKEAASSKHNVVMTPGKYCYFDYYQGNSRFEPLAIGGYTTVQKVYSFNPIPEKLKRRFRKYILGAQGNVWTEYIPDEKQVEYMVFPRICALSEVLWTNPAKKCKRKQESLSANFVSRLIKHFKLLDTLGINYSKSIFQLKFNVKPSPGNNGVLLDIVPFSKQGDVYFSSQISEPDINATKFDKEIFIDSDTVIYANYFVNGKPLGKALSQDYKFSESTGKKIELKILPSENYNYGGAFTLVDGIIGSLPWNSKEWLGFSGKNLEATIDMNKTTEISSVTVDCLLSPISWIYLPKGVVVYCSEDGVNYSETGAITMNEILEMNRELVVSFPQIKTRYVKIVAENSGVIPEGKNGAGSNAWLFVDEIIIK